MCRVRIIENDNESEVVRWGVHSMTAAQNNDGRGFERAKVVGITLSRWLIAGEQRNSIVRHEISQYGPTLFDITPIRADNDDGLALGQRLNGNVRDRLPGTRNHCARGGCRHPIGQRKAGTNSRADHLGGHRCCGFKDWCLPLITLWGVKG